MTPGTNQLLLSLGMVCPILFWLTTLACGVVQGDYNHLWGTISELSALGTRSQYLFTGLLILLSALGFGFCQALYRVCHKRNILPLTPVIIFFISNLGVALSPLGTPQHAVAGQTATIVLFSPLLALWYGKEIIPGYLALLTLFIFITSLVLALADILPDSFMQGYAGLLQRIFHVGWTCWFITLSIQFKKNSTLQS